MIRTLLPRCATLVETPAWWKHTHRIISAFDELSSFTLAAASATDDWRYEATTHRPRDGLRASTAMIARTAHIWPGCVFIGDVIIDDGCEIGPNAVIFGPTYIGPRSYVGPHAEVRRTYVAGALTMSHTSYLGHSIVGQDVTLSAGFVTAVRNLKRPTVHMLDEANLVNTGHALFGAVIADGFYCPVNTKVLPGRVLIDPITA